MDGAPEELPDFVVEVRDRNEVELLRRRTPGDAGGVEEAERTARY